MSVRGKGGRTAAQTALSQIDASGRFRLSVHCKPGARSTSLQLPPSLEEPVEMRLAAPPEGGRANKELIEFLEEHLKVHRSTVSIVQGSTSRGKVVEITFPGTADELWSALASAT